MLFSNVITLLISGAVYGKVFNDIYMDANAENKNKINTETNFNRKYDSISYKNFGIPKLDILLSNSSFIEMLGNMPHEIRSLVTKGILSEISPSKSSVTLKDSPINTKTTNTASVNIHDTKTSQSLSSTTQAAPLDKCTKQFSCVNCTASRICAPSPITHALEEIAQVYCSEDKPYCDETTGSCVASVETALKCAPPSLDFICLKNGYFPHPTDCARYYLCVDYKAYEFKCKQDYYYNAKSHACDLYYYSSNCYSFPCKGQNGVKVPYTFDSTIYAYCIGDKPFIISQCDGSYRLNATSQKCEPMCTHSGLYEDVAECTAYFKCVKNGLIYTRTRHNCPENEGFDPDEFQCVPLIQMSRCRPHGIQVTGEYDLYYLYETNNKHIKNCFKSKLFSILQ